MSLKFFKNFGLISIFFIQSLFARSVFMVSKLDIISNKNVYAVLIRPDSKAYLGSGQTSKEAIASALASCMSNEWSDSQLRKCNKKAQYKLVGFLNENPYFSLQYQETEFKTINNDDLLHIFLLHSDSLLKELKEKTSNSKRRLPTMLFNPVHEDEKSRDAPYEPTPEELENAVLQMKRQKQVIIGELKKQINFLIQNLSPAYRVQAQKIATQWIIPKEAATSESSEHIRQLLIVKRLVAYGMPPIAELHEKPFLAIEIGCPGMRELTLESLQSLLDLQEAYLTELMKSGDLRRALEEMKRKIIDSGLVFDEDAAGERACLLGGGVDNQSKCKVITHEAVCLK